MCRTRALAGRPSSCKGPTKGPPRARDGQLLPCRGFDWQDYLPKLMHCKPLFREVLRAMFSESFRVQRHGHHQLRRPAHLRLHRVACKYEDIEDVATGNSVKISEDLRVTKKKIWMIADAWSWYQAMLRGTRMRENVREMFLPGAGSEHEHRLRRTPSSTSTSPRSWRRTRSCLASKLRCAEKELDASMPPSPEKSSASEASGAGKKASGAGRLDLP